MNSQSNQIIISEVLEYTCHIFIQYINISIHNCYVTNGFFSVHKKDLHTVLFWFQAIFVGKKLGFSVFLLDLLTIVDN